MQIKTWLIGTEQTLKDADISTARLDAEVLLADKLQKDRSWILAHGDYVLDELEIETLNAQIKRRKQHEPMAYIRGKQEFYGREFLVSPATLTPRPETETMVELLKQQVESRKSKIENLKIIDVGTGSGCIIITAALELASVLSPISSVELVGIDNSDDALKIAKKNSKMLNAKVVFKHFELMKQDISSVLSPQTSILLANLPYVPVEFHINLAATHEPAEAIFGGPDGLDLYRKMFDDLKTDKTNAQDLLILTESLPPQHEKLRDIAVRTGYTQIDEQDFIQVFAS